MEIALPDPSFQFLHTCMEFPKFLVSDATSYTAVSLGLYDVKKEKTSVNPHERRSTRGSEDATTNLPKRTWAIYEIEDQLSRRVV